MKIFTKLFSAAILLCSSTIGANAQALGIGTVVNPNPPDEFQTLLQAVRLVYGTNGTTDYSKITKIQLADWEMMANVTINGQLYEVWPEVDIDPELANDLGQEFENNDWGNTLTIPFDEEVVAAGRPAGIYVIDIPEGLIRDENGNTNDSQTLTFTVVNTLAPKSVTPANGTYQPANLSNIQITFDRKMAVAPNAPEIYFMVKNDWGGDTWNIKDYQLSDDGTTLSFNLSTLLTRGVEYSICVPEGVLLSDDYYINKEIWMEFMNWDGMSQATIVSAPKSMTSQADVKPFILTWNYDPIHLADNAEDMEISLVCGFPDFGMQDGWSTDIPIDPDYAHLVYVDKDGNVNHEPAEGQANALYFDVSEFTEDFTGYQFTVTVPSGLVFNNENLDNPSFTYIFEVKNLWVDPDINIEGQFINIIWPYSYAAAYNMNSDLDPEVILTGVNNYEKVLEFNYGGWLPGEVGLLSVEDGTEYEHGLKVDLSDLDLEDGDYTLIIPQGYLMIQFDPTVADEFVMNDQVVFNFTWNNGEILESGIEQLYAPDGSVSVFDLQGRNVNVNQLGALKKGIYIVNGKKIFVK